MTKVYQVTMADGTTKYAVVEENPKMLSPEAAIRSTLPKRFPSQKESIAKMSRKALKIYEALTDWEMYIAKNASDQLGTLQKMSKDGYLENLAVARGATSLLLDEKDRETARKYKERTQHTEESSPQKKRITPQERAEIIQNLLQSDEAGAMREEGATKEEVREWAEQEYQAWLSESEYE